MKLERAMSVVAVFAVAAPLLALGDPFVYSDHWPSGSGDETATEVSIPDGTTATIATAADVARVARLTAITLGGSNAKVDYTAPSALALSADISGSGRFSAISSGDLTLSGDNSNLLAPGCFFFSNTAVTVASRYGLGSTGSGTLHYWFGDKVDPLHFSGAGLTNDAPVRIHQGTASGNFVLGPDDADETLVIANDFLFDGSNNEGKNAVYFRNKVRIRAGVFGADSSHLWARVSGSSAEVWLEEDVTVKFFYWFSYNNLRYHLGWSNVSGNRYWIVPYSPAVAVCEKSGLLDSLSRGISGNGTIDLNGHDQSIKYLSKTYGSPKFDSATPATLSVYDAGAESSAKFSGAVNFTYAPTTVSGTYTLTGDAALSDSCGTMTVGGVGHLVFANKAGWSGTNVVVQSGATLELKSDNAMTNATATLTIETGGRLILRSGAACVVKSATIAGTPLDSGRMYTVANLKAMGLPVDGDDLGFVDVRGGAAEWAGWPTAPGSIADVPEGMTIYVSDDDVATLAALGGINLRSGSAVVCTNLTRQLNLSASLTGTGTFKILDSECVTLSGDNSNLLSPGCFFFSNTAVTVASRYGLGSTGSGTLHYWFGDKVDPFHFSGAGLTNDAPVRIHQGTTNGNFVLGPDNEDETLVIANDFIFDGSNNHDAKVIYFRNNVRIDSGMFGTDSWHLWAVAYGSSAVVTFKEGVTLAFYYFISEGNVRYYFDWSGMFGNHHWIVPYNPVVAVCEKSGLLDGLGRGVSGNGTIDLNGYDQSIKYLSKTYGSLKFTSATPATLSVTTYSADADLKISSAKFSGAVNFTYAPTAASGAYTLTGSAALSDSTGKLTVGGAGQLAFADGAGWGGTNVLVKSGARLMVGAESMPVAFGTRALLGHATWTRLEIENGGVLELAASEKPATVRSFVYNGMQMPAGTYNRASGVGIEGDGTLYVRSSTDGEPGAMIIIR